MFLLFVTKKCGVCVIMYCRRTSLAGCVQGQVTADGQQGVEAIDTTGGKYAAEYTEVVWMQNREYVNPLFCDNCK